MSNSRDFTGKVAIVTGASSGVGAITVKKLSQFGAKVVVTGRDASRVRKVAEECRFVSPKSLEALQVVADLTYSKDVERLIRSTIDKFGKLDVLICNEGIFSSARIDSPKLLKTFDRTMLTNVRPALNLIQIATPYLEKSRGSSITITSSMLSFRPRAIYMPFCMSEASLDIMAKCLALHLGPKGIRVNTVNPAFVKNNLIVRSLGLGAREWSKELAKAGQSYPLGRPVTVEDIANTLIFLSSEDAAFITGQNICLDGGST